MNQIKIKQEVKEFLEQHNIKIENTFIGLDIKYKKQCPQYAYITDYQGQKLCISTVSSHWNIEQSIQYMLELSQAVNLLNQIKQIQPELVA